MAIPLMAIGMGLNFANSLFGGFQLLRGLSQAKSNRRPEYNIPQEIGQNLNQAQLMAQQGLPMDVYNRNAGAIDRNMAFGLRSSADRRGGLQSLGALNQGANDAYSNLMAQDAQARMANLAQLYNMRNTMANYRDKAFEVNQMQPFQQKAAEAQGLQGAGLRNIMGGLQGAANVASSQAMYNAMNPNAMGGMGGAETMFAQGGGIPQMQQYGQQNAEFGGAPSPFQQGMNPYQMMMMNFNNGYSGIGSPNYVGTPQFFNQKF
jgi:hypothetical protein